MRACVSAAATDTIASPRKPKRFARPLVARARARLNLGGLTEIRGPEHLADFRLALPARPMLPVELQEAPRPLDRFLLRRQLEHGISADDFFGLGEWSVDHLETSLPKTNRFARCGWGEASCLQHRARADGLQAELLD